MARPDPDGDPSRNATAQRPGGRPVVIDMTVVCRDDSNGPGRSADNPSTGRTAPPGPCA